MLEKIGTLLGFQTIGDFLWSPLIPVLEDGVLHLQYASDVGLVVFLITEGEGTKT